MKGDNFQHFQHHQREKSLNSHQIKGIKAEMLKTYVSLWEIYQIHCQAQWYIPDMVRLLRTRISIKLGYTANSNLINICHTKIVISAINTNMSILTKYWTIQAYCWPRVILGLYTQVTSIMPFMIFTMMNITLTSKTLFKMITMMSHHNNH